MCDTFLFRHEAQNGSKIWFGKNSDREPNEAHEVVFHKGKNQLAGTMVKCTYIEVPQVPATFDVILCKLAWMWGAEMGVNIHGVVIGNEALFTKGNPPREPALTGMDLLRLALERSQDAQSALGCITSLLEQFGQGGNCGFSHPFYYNNSFLIADRKETWVLETVGREWAARCFKTSTAISNGLTLHKDWDKASAGFAGLKDLARQKSDPLITAFSQAGKRRACVLDGLEHLIPEAGLQDAFKILRSHAGAGYSPDDSLTSNTVCMHAGFGPVRIDQTTGSLVVDLSDGRLDVWITGTSAPCLSVFRPALFSDYSEDTIISSERDWLDNEIFHRNGLFCQDDFIRTFTSERDTVESGFIRVFGHSEKKDKTIDNVTSKCADERNAFINQWKQKAISTEKVRGHFLLRTAWKEFNREANLSINL
jgi:secernin